MDGGYVPVGRKGPGDGSHRIVFGVAWESLCGDSKHVERSSLRSHPSTGSGWRLAARYSKGGMLCHRIGSSFALFVRGCSERRPYEIITPSSLTPCALGSSIPRH